LTRNTDARANMTATSLGGNMQVKDYGIKKSWDGWRTYAHVSDGTPLGLMPINWANGLFKTKQEAKAYIEKLANENNWSCR
jgi:hypothetical protein